MKEILNSYGKKKARNKPRLRGLWVKDTFNSIDDWWYSKDGKKVKVEIKDEKDKQ